MFPPGPAHIKAETKAQRISYLLEVDIQCGHTSPCSPLLNSRLAWSRARRGGGEIPSEEGMEGLESMKMSGWGEDHLQGQRAGARRAEVGRAVKSCAPRNAVGGRQWEDV